MYFLSNVFTAFNQVVILFLVAMVGFFCQKTGIYTEKASRLTTDLLFYIVTPAVIIRSFVSIDYNPEALKGLLAAIAGGAFFHLVAILLSEAFFGGKRTTENSGIFKFGSVYGNVGYMALPLALAVLGDEGVFYCSVILVPFNILSFTHGVRVMQKKGERTSFGIKNLIANPGVIGVALGLPLFLAGVELPEVIYAPVSYLADLNTPLAMVMFGTYLACADWKRLFSEKAVFSVALIKIIIVPAVTIAVLKLAGFGGTLFTACVLSAAAPTANNTVMFSAKYGRDTALASKITAFISVLSIVTMPVMIAVSQSI